MQKKVVFERPIDKLGRIVIPIDVRRMYEIESRDMLSIIPTEDGILIQKA